MLNRVLKTVNMVLVAAVVFFAVTVFYQGLEYRLDIAAMLDFQPETGRTETSGKSRSEKSNDSAEFGDYKVIATRNLFNIQTEKQSEGEEISTRDIKDMEKTGLDFRLWGTITETGGSCYAVIEKEPDGKQQLYRAGDRIGQARIKKILRKRVVLNVDGKDEVLEIEDLVEGEYTTASREGGNGSQSVSGGEDISIELKRERISEMLQDINNLMRQVRVRPYYEQGEPAGIILSAIQQNSIFEEMGLESGDIIKSANGTSIRSMDDAMAFYRDLSSAGKVELEIERRGSRQKINYSIE